MCVNIYVSIYIIIEILSPKINEDHGYTLISFTDHDHSVFFYNNSSKRGLIAWLCREKPTKDKNVVLATSWSSSVIKMGSQLMYRFQFRIEIDRPIEWSDAGVRVSYNRINWYKLRRMSDHHNKTRETTCIYHFSAWVHLKEKRIESDS